MEELAYNDSDYDSDELAYSPIAPTWLMLVSSLKKLQTIDSPLLSRIAKGDDKLSPDPSEAARIVCSLLRDQKCCCVIIEALLEHQETAVTLRSFFEELQALLTNDVPMVRRWSCKSLWYFLCHLGHNTIAREALFPGLCLFLSGKQNLDDANVLSLQSNVVKGESENSSLAQYQYVIKKVFAKLWLANLVLMERQNTQDQSNSSSYQLGSPSTVETHRVSDLDSATTYTTSEDTSRKSRATFNAATLAAGIQGEDHSRAKSSLSISNSRRQSSGLALAFNRAPPTPAGEVRKSVLQRIMNNKDHRLDGDGRSTSMSTALTLNSVHTFSTERDLPYSIYELDLDALHVSAPVSPRASELSDKKGGLRRTNSVFDCSQKGVHPLDCLTILDLLIGDPVRPTDVRHSLPCSGYDQLIRPVASCLLNSLMQMLNAVGDIVVKAKVIGGLSALVQSNTENTKILLSVGGWRFMLMRLLHSVPEDKAFRTVMHDIVYTHVVSVITTATMYQVGVHTKIQRQVYGDLMYEAAIHSGWKKESIGFVGTVLQSILDRRAQLGAEQQLELLRMIEVFVLYTPIKTQSINPSSDSDSDFESDADTNDFVWSCLLPKSTNVQTSADRIDYMCLRKTLLGTGKFGLHLTAEGHCVSIDKQLVRSVLSARTGEEEGCLCGVLDRLKQVYIAMENIDAIVEEYKERIDEVAGEEMAELSDTVLELQRELLSNRVNTTHRCTSECNYCKSQQIHDTGLKVESPKPMYLLAVYEGLGSLRPVKVVNRAAIGDMSVGDVGKAVVRKVDGLLRGLCAGCKLPLEEEERARVLSDGVGWHKEHMRCVNCNKTLSDEPEDEMVFTGQGWLCCIECANTNNSTCPVCGVPCDTQVKSHDRQQYHPNHISCELCGNTAEQYHTAAQGPLKPLLCSRDAALELSRHCRSCGDRVEECVEVDGVWYHNTGDCLKCHACGDSLGVAANCFQRGFDGYLYCESCATVYDRPNCIVCLERFNSSEESVVFTSSKDQVPVREGVSLGFDGRPRAHMRCVGCKECGVKLEAGVVLFVASVSGLVYCSEHLDCDSSGVVVSDSSDEEPLLFHYIDSSGDQQGPIGVDSLCSLMKSGQVQKTTLVWSPGMTEWSAVESIGL